MKVKFKKDCMNVCKYIWPNTFYEVVREEKSTIWVVDETGTKQPYHRAWVEERKDD